MYSENISGILNLNPIKSIEDYAKNHPDEFRKDVSTLSENGDSILINFLKRGFNEDFYGRFLDLITQFGYDFKKNVKPTDVFSKNLNLNTTEFTPEFISALASTRNDKILSEFAKVLGKDYFLSLEKKGWHILETLFDKTMPKTITVMAEFGLNFEYVPSGRRLLSIAERNNSLADLYWQIVLKSKNEDTSTLSDEQFKHFISIIDKKCNQIHSKKDYLVEEVITQINDKFDKLNDKQKLALIDATVVSKDLSVLRTATKKMGIKSTDPIVQLASLKKRHKLQNKDLLVPIINNPPIMTKKIQTELHIGDDWKIGETNGLKLFSLALRNFSIFPFENSSRNYSSSVAIREKLVKVYDEKTLLNTVDENGKNLFELILDITNDTPNGSNNLFGLLNKSHQRYHKSGMSFESITNADIENLVNKNISDITKEQAEEINKFMNLSWRKLGSISDTMTHKVLKNMLEDKFFVVHPSIIKSDKVYTREEKVFLLSQVINVIGQTSWNIGFFANPETYSAEPKNVEPNTNQVFKILYKEILENPTKDILSINIDENVVKNIEHTSFYKELQTVMMKEALSKDLSDKKETTKKMKI